MSVIVMEPEELERLVSEAVDRTVSERVPEIVKRITEDTWMTTEDVENEFKLTRPQQAHYRDTRQLSFTKHKRKIFYKRADLVDFMEENHIPARDK